MPVVAPQAKWTWSEDVLELARKQGIEPYLDRLMEATLGLFPTAREVRVEVHHDPEIPDWVHLVWDVDLPKEDVHNYLELKREWDRLFIDICPLFRQVPMALILIPVK